MTGGPASLGTTVRALDMWFHTSAKVSPLLQRYVNALSPLYTMQVMMVLHMVSQWVNNARHTTKNCTHTRQSIGTHFDSNHPLLRYGCLLNCTHLYQSTLTTANTATIAVCACHIVTPLYAHTPNTTPRTTHTIYNHTVVIIE